VRDTFKRYSYRPDIDGLRGLAVTAVLAFHAFPDALPSGFIGVDIFFVISGYLIGGILLKDQYEGRFSLRAFYARRIRRIFPALLLILAASLGLGWFCLLTSEYQQLGKHTAAAAAFVSNLVLWMEAGYFDSVAETKPLLHLWSLAVEEQFYIIFPFLIRAAAKCRSAFVWLFGGLALLSFSYNVGHALEHSAAAFYSPLSRFWELACGGLLAYVHLRKVEQDRQYAEGGDLEADATKFHLATLQSLIGIVLLAAGFIEIDKTLPFPGKWALLPVLGTALLIAAGPSAFVNRRLLSNRALVGLGLISYPLYLWHWPLLSFAHIQLSGTLPVDVRVGALALSLVLAWLTYVMLEKPIRLGGSLGAKAAVLLLSMIVVGGAGFQIYRSPDMSERVAHNLAPYLDVTRTTQSKPVKTTVAMVPDSDATDEMRQQFKKNLRADGQYIGELFDAKMKVARYRVCYMYDNDRSTRAFQEYLKGNAECIELSPSKKNILILGDSVAADLYMALSHAYPEIHFLEITGSACKPFLKAYHGEYPACEQLIKYALNFAEKTKLDGVIIGSSWADDYQLVRQELRRLREAGHKLLLVGPPLKFSAEVARIVERLSANDRLDAALERTLVKEDVLRADEMAGFAASEKATYLNWQQLYCTQGCPVLNEQGALLILDRLHLSVPGADRLGECIKEHRILETAFQLQ